MGVTVAVSPTKGLDATLGLAERLAGRGYQVVPHLSARLVRDDAHLADVAARLTACGIDDIFVPAGYPPPPLGRFVIAPSFLQPLALIRPPPPPTPNTHYPHTHPPLH